MQPYSSINFFIIVFVFVVMIWSLTIIKKYKYIEYILFLGTLAFNLVLFKEIINKVLLFTIFYIVLIKLAGYYKKVPRILFIISAVMPLILFKISDINHFLNPIHKYFAFTGISYITFRVIQVLVDIEVYPPKSMFNLTTFLINPLSLLAGPIDRFYRFEKNIEEINESLNKETFLSGWYFLIIGAIQKYLLAYYWNMFVMSKFSINSYQVSDIVGVAYSYTVYLFLDFSGYSLMAVGLSYMMGILTPMNFDRPWKTKNPQDLWRRFHITLGSFLNDYFFKPIYMSLIRKKFFKPRKLLTQNIALFLTFLLMGAWNGLKWYYLLSGVMFGLSSVAYNTYNAKMKNKPHTFNVSKLIGIYRFIFLNYIVWALYLFSGKIP